MKNTELKTYLFDNFKLSALRKFQKRKGLKHCKTKSELIDLIISEVDDNEIREYFQLAKKKSRRRKISFFSILAGLALIAGLYADLPLLFSGIKGLFVKESYICDPDKDAGCTLDLNISNSIVKDLSVFGLPTTKRDSNSVIAEFKIANKKYLDIIPKFKEEDKSVDPFELLPKRFLSEFRLNQISPFEIYHDGKNIMFNGKIFDYKNDELLGWFDQNDFETGDCAFRWNKDENGVEIIDKYGFVAFSIDLDKGKETRISDSGSYQNLLVYFKGYFKNESEVFIFNESFNRTSDLQEAKEMIEKIKPIFKHVGRDSYGKRINEK